MGASVDADDGRNRWTQSPVGRAAQSWGGLASSCGRAGEEVVCLAQEKWMKRRNREFLVCAGGRREGEREGAWLLIFEQLGFRFHMPRLSPPLVHPFLSILHPHIWTVLIICCTPWITTYTTRLACGLDSHLLHTPWLLTTHLLYLCFLFWVCFIL